MYNEVIDIVENYGWYILIASIISVYVYQKYIKEKVKRYLKERDDRDYVAKYHKNPDLFNARVKAQEARVQKLQEEYNQQAAEHLRKQEEKSAKKLEELEEKYLKGGHQLKSSKAKDENQNKSLRSDYNPLMGSSGSNYRPPKRSACGGGGCGK